MKLFGTTAGGKLAPAVPKSVTPYRLATYLLLAAKSVTVNGPQVQKFAMGTDPDTKLSWGLPGGSLTMGLLVDLVNMQNRSVLE